MVCNECGYEKFLGAPQHDLDNMYATDSDYTDDLAVSQTGTDMMLWHHWAALEALRKIALPVRSAVLDVGCFNGFFVKQLCALGYDAHGIDFNKVAIESGRNRFALGERISSSSLDELERRGAVFDAVFLFEVLEHLPDPPTMLIAVAKLLRPNGVVVISAPNQRMCWRPALDFPPHHFSRFTLKSLRRLSERVHLEFVSGREQMSTQELVRHFAGSLFRDRSRPSLRGGEFRYKALTTLLRRCMNASRKWLNILLAPLDWLLHRFGCRYISQIIVVKKTSGADQLRAQSVGVPGSG